MPDKDLNITPGQWNAKYGNYVYADEQQTILIATCVPLNGTSKELETAFGNARLIATAPELLETIEHVLTASENGGDMCDIDWQRLRNIVAKAKKGRHHGQQQD